MPLTDTAIRKAKPPTKPLKMADGGGLYLLLRPDGARWWRWDYRRPVTGKRNTLSLGTYPDTGLAAEFAGGPVDEARRARILASIPLGRFSTALDVAHAVCYLASDEASFISGVCLEVDGARCV